MLVEPQLDVSEIQGNLIPGFFKPHMQLLGLDVQDVKSSARFLAALASRLTTLGEVMQARKRLRASEQQRLNLKLRALAGERVRMPMLELDDVWLNLALSYRGITGLAPSTRNGFADDAFRLGMTVRGTSLGDPPGIHSIEPDVFLIIGADQADRLEAYVSSLLNELRGIGFHLRYSEYGYKRDAIGTEHFGFQDGISQPGVRGRFDSGDEDFITQRTTKDAYQRYGLPGQYLVWPGDFVFGYPTQTTDPFVPGPVNLPGGDWLRNGSFLAYRRLRQDVAGFRTFVNQAATQLGEDPEKLAAQLVGRWPSGAPLSRAPHGDVPELGLDRQRNNYFEFGIDADSLPLLDGTDAADVFTTASTDPLGLVCPMFAHIRKINTRSGPNDAGGQFASYTRRILRRGLPFGPPYEEAPHAERGLLFLSYQTSIVNQFEFLHRRWMGDPASPHGAPGHDLVAGQNGQPGQDRVRTVRFADERTLSTKADYVIPSGGGYFFAPSISTIKALPYMER